VDILHLHDWHTAFCAPLAKGPFKEKVAIKKILLTIHNGEYQGECSSADLDRIGIDSGDYLSPESSGAINLMRAGIVHSDAVNAVSESYAKEVMTRELGFNLDSTFRKYKDKLSGIVNGIDQKLWNPKTDPALSVHYSAENATSSILEAKKKNKLALARRFHLDASFQPWVGAVTRLVSQKGPELLQETLKYTVEQGGVFLLLGSSPSDPGLRAEFDALQQEYKGHPRVFLQFSYDDALAHQIYAALDFLIAPSLFEPCGLTQLIAMHYGTVPIVRATGGLKDTVFDFEDSTIPAAQRNGFTFSDATLPSLRGALERALHLFRSDPASFHLLIKRGMQLDFSWKKPAQKYKRLYQKMLNRLLA
jgi:starch synthase